MSLTDMNPSWRKEISELLKYSSDNYTKAAFDFAYSNYFISHGIACTDFQYEGVIKNSDQVSSKEIGEFFKSFGFELGSSFYEESPRRYQEFARYENNKFSAFYYSENGYIKVERKYEMKDGKEEGWFYFDASVAVPFNKEHNFISKFVDKYCELEEKDEDDDIAGRIYTLVDTPHGYQLTEFDNMAVKFQPDNYPEEISNGFTKMVTNFGLERPNGRLSLLTGEPGTGKTYFIRGLINAFQKCKFVIVDPAIMSTIGKPQMVNTFLSISNKNKPTVLLIEDADSCLVQRMSDNMSYISQLLNLTDGIYGDAMNIHVIASTNQHNLEIDDALKRPGRLHQILNFRMLNQKEAERIYIREVGSAPEVAFKKAESTIKAKKFGFGRQEEVEEPTMVTIAEVYSKIRDIVGNKPLKEEIITNNKSLDFMMFE